MSEHIGEAIGLSVANRLHGFTEADWSLIAQQHGQNAVRTFDYDIASDGERYVQIETKGSSVQDNRTLSDSIAAHKRSIKAKKQQITELEAGGQQPHAHPNAIRYGTICALDPRPESRAKCWLVDPRAEPVTETPRRLKLMNRMRFLRDWISFVSPRSQLSSALATRVADLESLRDPYELDSVPLRRSGGDEFDLYPYSVREEMSSFFATRSVVVDGPAGGVVIKLTDDIMFFAGVLEDIPLMAANQDFAGILEYRRSPGTVVKAIECVISRGRFSAMRLDVPTSPFREEKIDGYVRFRLRGQLHYTGAGAVFGLLPLASYHSADEPE